MIRNGLRRLKRAVDVAIADAYIWHKWRRDASRLPLTSSHWELYRIIHHRLMDELGEFPELADCRDFNDRIQWLKLFDQEPDMIRCSDKLGVRSYIREQVGPKYLTSLYQDCCCFGDIDFSALPEQFVIKTSHDSGTVVLVRDKNAFDFNSAKKRIENSLARPYGWMNGEWAYAFVTPRILVEEFLEPNAAAPPPDYKFYVCEGRVRFVHYIYDRGSATREQTLTPDGTDIHTPLYPRFAYGDGFVKPPCWEEMKRVAEKLGSRFKCVRVDLFYAGGRVYCGEMTFWPMFGAYKGDGQRQLGALLDFDRTSFKPPISHAMRRPPWGFRR